MTDRKANSKPVAKWTHLPFSRLCVLTSPERPVQHRWTFRANKSSAGTAMQLCHPNGRTVLDFKAGGGLWVRVAEKPRSL